MDTIQDTPQDAPSGGQEATSLDFSNPLGDVVADTSASEPVSTPDTIQDTTGTSTSEEPVSEETEASPSDQSFSLDEAAYAALGYVKHGDGYHFMHEEDPELGLITYKDHEAGRIGLREKQRHIHRVSGERDEWKGRYETSQEEISSLREANEALAQRLSDGDREAFRAQQILEKRHPEFKGITSPKQLGEKDAQARWQDAMLDARAEVRLESLREQELAQAEQKRTQHRIRQSEEAYGRVVNKEFFGVSNVEEVAAMKRILTSDSGYSYDGKPVNHAQNIYLMALEYGEEVAKVYAEGLKARFYGSRTVRRQAPPSVTQESEVAPADPPPTKPRPKSAREAIARGIAAQRR